MLHRVESIVTQELQVQDSFKKATVYDETTVIEQRDL